MAGILEVEEERARFAAIGVNVKIAEPGQPNCPYHSEPVQDAVLMIGSRRLRRSRTPGR